MILGEQGRPPDAPTQLWTFTVAVTAAGFRYSTELRREALTNHNSIEIEGLVERGQPLITRTSVYANIWAGGEDWADMIRAEGAIGRATISRDVARIRRFSVAPSKPLAGIDIAARLPEAEVRRIWDVISKGNLDRVSMEFGCTGTQIHQDQERLFSKPELVLHDDDVELKIVSLEVRTALGNFAEVAPDELK